MQSVFFFLFFSQDLVVGILKVNNLIQLKGPGFKNTQTIGFKDDS
jgi:hypothetical protein